VETKKLKTLLSEHYPILGVLLACFLVLTSTGTYTNWDSQLEFEAASSVTTRGFPFVTTGLIINQPPLGFYMDAPVFHIWGLSYLNGVGIATAFGLGTVLALYALGALLYGKLAGVVAAALFGLVPWHVYISRIFLIDNQFLFFGLLFLIVGILAVKKNSEKLILTSGILFAVAFMTKLFAVFLLVPLLLTIFLRKDWNFKLTVRKALIFLAPLIILQVIWFGGFANQNFLGVYFSSDFTHPELVADPSPFFLPIILVKSAGYFLFAAGTLALAIAAFYRKELRNILWLDAVCAGTIAVIAGLDLLLVLGFHLTVPYVSAFKYNYVALPFFCLLAASLVHKSNLLIDSIKQKTKQYYIRLSLSGAGFALLFASLIESTLFLEKWVGFVSFGVDSVTYYGFFVFSEPNYTNLALYHNLALAIVVCSIALPPLITSLLKNRKINKSQNKSNESVVSKSSRRAL
jgi:4-amino-4-deoxy-L-arabinose transferase-like glycosyltransferase